MSPAVHSFPFWDTTGKKKKKCCLNNFLCAGNDNYSENVSLCDDRGRIENWKWSDY